MEEREVKLNIQLYANRTKTQYKNGCKEEKEQNKCRSETEKK
jgi:hypothetical protein